MGLAPFFDRTSQSAAQVLCDFDRARFEERLNEVVVGLRFDRNAASSPEGRAALDMAARLIARLYPRVRVQALYGDVELAEQLVGLMRAINPAISIEEEPPARAITVVAGGNPGGDDGDRIYMGSDRWVARVSTTRPVSCGTSGIPFGAGAAACIALANVFRLVFSDMIAKPALDEQVTFSLLNFEIGERAANGDIPSGASIGLVQLAGVGAIGNAFVWSLGRLAGVEGVLHTIDHETIDLTNLQRYVLATIADVGAQKVALASSVLADSGIRPIAFAETWAGYVAGLGHHHFDTVAVALDTARDRVQVQSSLPRRVVNAWTQSGDLGISRHAFDGDAACMACLYLPTGTRRNEDQIIAEELGFPPERIQEIRTMLHFDMPVTAAMITEIANQRGMDVDALLPFANLPLRVFRQNAICGNAQLRAADGGGPEVEVPLAFQSALAGVMLAAEIVASSPGVRPEQPATRSVVDLMRRLPARVTMPLMKGSIGPARCICQDEDYLEVYRQKYSEIE